MSPRLRSGGGARADGPPRQASGYRQRTRTGGPMIRTIRSLASVLLTLAALAGPATAQRSHVGGHVGYDFDRNDAVLGGQLSLPFNRFLELYPSVDVFFVDTGSRLG